MRLEKTHYCTISPTLSFIDTRVLSEVCLVRGVWVELLAVRAVGACGVGEWWCCVGLSGLVRTGPVQVAFHESVRSRRSTGTARPTVA